jgi:maltose alpha-D-glucosyltransferase/alpha-amylase
LPWYEATKNDGYISLITGNHDTPRISHGLSAGELALTYAVIFTMPGVPFLYYGDEIGMRYLYDLPTKEGGYGRTGSRTPMQWQSGGGMGFSCAPPEKFYLAVDPSPIAPNVADQEKDPSSLLNTVKTLLRLRRGEQDLGARPNLEILHPTVRGGATSGGTFGDRAFIFRRGVFIIGVNPGAETVTIPLSINEIPKPVYSIGSCTLENGLCRLESQSFGIWKV